MSLAERCRKIEMLVMDVDGVLTDGSIVYADQGVAEQGVEMKTFHVRDGSGVKLWLNVSKQAALLTGRRSAVVVRRAAELGLATVVQGADDKLAAFTKILADHGLQEDQAAYVGDDLPDLPVLGRCGLAV